MAAITLAGLADTQRLGTLLAEALLASGCPPLLLAGRPGCGKTALTACICAAFPGGGAAEVSSPSFTICNIYPTSPPIMHCDLYRCHERIPDEALDFIDDRSGQIIIEWAHYLKPLPLEYLDISFDVINNARRLEFNASGDNAGAALAHVISRWTR